MTKSPRSTEPAPKMDQSNRFLEKARELGCDETGEAFERAFGKIAPPKRPNGGTWMAEVQQIANQADIVPGRRYILIRYADKETESRHGNGYTFELDRSLSGDTREAKFNSELERAQSLALDEDIGVIYVLR